MRPRFRAIRILILLAMPIMMTTITSVAAPCSDTSKCVSTVAQGEFLINFGITGSWYNPITNGQGWIFEVVPSFDPPVMVAYNFAFPPELAAATEKGGGPMGPGGGPMMFSGNQMWLVGAGEIDGDTVTIEVQRPFGGHYNMPMEPLMDHWGIFTFIFHDCLNATVIYDSPLDEIDGEYDITRLTPDVICESGGLAGN